VLSHIRQLFNAEQCQAYFHTLQRNDRPLHMSPVPEPQRRSLHGL
jgi:hypothetical protein